MPNCQFNPHHNPSAISTSPILLDSPTTSYIDELFATTPFPPPGPAYYLARRKLWLIPQSPQDPGSILHHAPLISAGMNPFHWNLPESAGMAQESTGMGRNPQEWHWNGLKWTFWAKVGAKGIIKLHSSGLDKL